MCLRCGCHGYRCVGAAEAVEGAEAAAVGEELLDKHRGETIQHLPLIRDTLTAAAHTHTHRRLQLLTFTVKALAISHKYDHLALCVR